MMTLRLVTLLCVCAAGLLSLPVRGQRIHADAAMAVPAEVEVLYNRGLGYLARMQQKDGTWPDGQSRQPGVVALAVLAFLASGEDPNHGPYSEQIRRSLTFVLQQQSQENGYIGTSMYNHGFATLALAEAYGTVDDPRLGPALAKAVKLLLSSQARNPHKAWRYGPDSNDADTTVSGACVVALYAARNAGIAVPDKSLEQAIAWFKACQGPDGGFGYTYRGASTPPRAAIGTLVLSLGKQHGTRAYRAAFQHLAAIDHAQEGGHMMYFLYYASQAMFHGDSEAWNKWNAQNIQLLSALQAEDGSWNSNQGPTFGTSTALLSLALNYRFLPIYER